MVEKKEVIPLTDEQRKLVEDNIGLINGYINKYNIKYDVDSVYSILAIGLCNAARTYDSNKGEFSTYAYHAMKGEMCHTWAYINRKRRIPLDKIVYYNANHVHGRNDEEDEYAEVILGNDEYGYENVISKMVANNYIEQIKPRLTVKELKVFEMILDGKTRNYIAEQCGCSVPCIAQNIWNIRKKSKDVLEQIKI